MFFRLDDSDISLFLAIHGYQDIRTMSDQDVAAAILSRLDPCGAGGAACPPQPALPLPRVFIRTLPTVDPHLFGRDAQLAWLVVPACACTSPTITWHLPASHSATTTAPKPSTTSQGPSP
jgi:hypothetical protein